MFDPNYKGMDLNIERKSWFWQQTKVIMFEHHISNQTTYVANVF